MSVQFRDFYLSYFLLKCQDHWENLMLTILTFFPFLQLSTCPRLERWAGRCWSRLIISWYFLRAFKYAKCILPESGVCYPVYVFALTYHSLWSLASSNSVPWDNQVLLLLSSLCLSGHSPFFYTLVSGLIQLFQSKLLSSGISLNGSDCYNSSSFGGPQEMRATLPWHLLSSLLRLLMTRVWQRIGRVPSLHSRPQIKINCEFVSSSFTRTYSKKERQVNGLWKVLSFFSSKFFFLSIA